MVLVGTSHPGNVGAAARAMSTMGLSDLRLAAPRSVDIAEHPEAVARATGARAVLADARVYESLQAAMADVVWAIAVSAEPREFGPAPVTPEAGAQEALAVLAAHPEHRVALVFGAERTGLSIEEVQACGALCSIPASPDRASLNLAQAVQVLSYCLRRAALDQVPPPTRSAHDRLADQAAVQGALAHAERSLKAIGFLDPDHPKKALPRLRRLLLRARLRSEEVDLLRGIFKRMEKPRS